MATSMFDTSGGTATAAPTSVAAPTAAPKPTYGSVMQGWQSALDTQINTPPNAEHFAASNQITGPGGYSEQLQQFSPAEAQAYWDEQNANGGAQRREQEMNAQNYINSNGQMGWSPTGQAGTMQSGTMPAGLLGGATQPAQATAQPQQMRAPRQAQPVQQGQGMLGGAPQMGQLQTGAGGPFAGFGWDAVAPVQEAMMGRLQPGMQQAREAEISRLKAQGIPENSPAWSRAMDTLNRSDVDARQQALLGGLGEQNTLWNQNLQQANFGNQSNQQAFGQRLSQEQLAAQVQANQAAQAAQQGQLTIQQRQQAMAEQNNPFQQMMWLNSMQSNPAFSQFVNAGANKGVDYTKAGEDAYQAELARSNSESAAQAAKQAAIAQILGGVGSSAVNGGAASGIASGLGGLLSGAGSWLGNLFGGK